MNISATSTWPSNRMRNFSEETYFGQKLPTLRWIAEASASLRHCTVWNQCRKRKRKEKQQQPETSPGQTGNGAKRAQDLMRPKDSSGIKQVGNAQDNVVPSSPCLLKSIWNLLKPVEFSASMSEKSFQPSHLFGEDTEDQNGPVSYFFLSLSPLPQQFPTSTGLFLVPRHVLGSLDKTESCSGFQGKACLVSGSTQNGLKEPTSSWALAKCEWHLYPVLSSLVLSRPADLVGRR